VIIIVIVLGACWLFQKLYTMQDTEQLDVGIHVLRSGSLSQGEMRKLARRAKGLPEEEYSGPDGEKSEQWKTVERKVSIANVAVGEGALEAMVDNQGQGQGKQGQRNFDAVSPQNNNNEGGQGKSSKAKKGEAF